MSLDTFPMDILLAGKLVGDRVRKFLSISVNPTSILALCFGVRTVTLGCVPISGLLGMLSLLGGGINDLVVNSGMGESSR